MNFEKSCGAIVYRKFHGNTELLLIKHANGGHWSFPKGHVEAGETELQTAEREIPYKENYHGHVYTGGESSKRYHYEAGCAGKYSHEITWDEVEQRGLGPCGTCVLK